MDKLKFNLKKLCALLVFAAVAVCVVCLSACVFPESGDSGSGGSQTDKNFYIGDTLTSDSLSFKVTGVSNTSVLGTDLVGVKTENNFIVVTVTISNGGDTEKSVTSSYVTLLKGTAKYEISSGSIYLDNGFYIIESVGAGITKTVTFAFETPTKSTADEYVLQVRGSSVAKTQKIILKEKT